MQRFLIIIVVTFLITLAGLFVWLQFGVDQKQIQSLLGNTLGPDYTVEIESARVSPLQRGISIGNMTVSSAKEDHIFFRTDTLNISGISPGIIFRNKISLSNLMMDTFTIDWDESLVEEDDDSEDEKPVSRLDIGSLDLINGTVIIRDGHESKQYNALNLKADISIDFLPETDSLDTPQHRISIDSLGFLFSDDRYRFSLSEFNFDHQDSLLTLTSMKLKPVGGYFQFMSSLEYEDNMFDMEISNLMADGIDLAAYRNHKIVTAGTMDFDGFSIHVAKDKQLPEKPDKELPELINKKIQDLPFAIQINSLIFRNTNIQYSEQDEEGTRPGTISFMNSSIQIHDVNSRSDTPATLNAVTYLQNHSELNTKLSLTLHDGPFHMTGSGNLQPFDFRELNSIFMDLEGIEVVSGNSLELDFYFEMFDDSSSGRMHLVYENLEMKIIDKDDYSESTSDVIVGFITNNVVLRPDNLADSNGEVRTGEINHVREPDSAFFQHLWHTLRSGIYDIVLRF